jgi:beta-glucosidase
MASDQVPGYRAITLNASHPRVSNGRILSPEVLYWGPRMVQALWNPTEIFITENGCAASDEPPPMEVCSTPIESCSCGTI